MFYTIGFSHPGDSDYLEYKASLTPEQPGAVVESVERGPRVQEIGSSVPNSVKPMTYKTDICHFRAWRLAIIGFVSLLLFYVLATAKIISGRDNNRIEQGLIGSVSGNVTEWDIGS